MTEKEIKELFDKWLKENYNWWDAHRYSQDSDYQSKPLFQYWIQNIAPLNPDYQIKRLESTLDELFQTGVISSEQQADLWEDIVNSSDWGKIDTLTYFGRPQEYLSSLGADSETVEYLMGYTDKNDLADRINGLNVDSGVKANIYDTMLYGVSPTDFALRGAQGRYQTEQERVKQAELQQRMNIVPTLNENITTLSNLPFVTDADRLNLYKKNRSLMNAGLTENERFGLLGDMIVGVGQKAATRAVGEEQRNRALLGGTQNINQSGFYQEPKGVPYTGDSAEKILNEYLESTGYSSGTRLRSFLEGKLGDIYSNTKDARQQWIKDIMTPEPELPSYEDEQNRLQQAVDTWNSVEGSASPAEYTSGTYWGTGGLKQMALDTAARTQQTLQSLNPADYEYGTAARAASEDPLKLALRGLDRKKLLAEYNRQPGVGATSRLAPALRF